MKAKDAAPRTRLAARELLLPLAALSAAVLVWGTTFVVSSDALDKTSPAVLTVLRFAVAALVLVPLAVGRPEWRQTIWSWNTAVLGLTGVAAYYGLQNAGLLTTPAGTAALLQGVLPLATAALGVAWLGERPGPVAGLGLVVATAGMVIVAGAELSGLDAGAALIVGGVVAYAAYTVRLQARPLADVVVLAAATCVWGLAFLIPWLAWETINGQSAFSVSTSLVIAVCYLGLAASAGTLLLWTYGAARVPSTVAGAFTAAIPAVGYALAALTGQGHTMSRTLAALLTLCGAVIVTLADRGHPTQDEQCSEPVDGPRPGDV